MSIKKFKYTVSKEYIDKYPELVKVWQRLEARSRNDDFTQNIQVRVKDPLWMMGRQWQMGEFVGEDTGSPVNVRIELKPIQCSSFIPGKNGNDSKVMNAPLEVMVEKEPWVINHLMSIQIGQYLEKSLQKGGATDELIEDMKTKISLESTEEIDADSKIFLDLMAGKVISGKKVFNEALKNEHIKVPDHWSIPAENIAIVTKALKETQLWFQQIYGAPEQALNKSWNNESLEYQFRLGKKDEATNQVQPLLSADEHTGGDLDWDAFSANEIAIEKVMDSVVEKRLNENFFAVETTFPGMPQARWWGFEDSKINFGKLDAKVTDLTTLLLIQFALVYSNDWYTIPIPTEIGNVFRISKVEITDTFGEKHILMGDPEDNGTTELNQPTFSLSAQGGTDTDLFFLPPSLKKPESSPAIEEILFARDEGANIIWAIEQKVTNGLGESLDATDSIRERNQQIEANENRKIISQLVDFANTNITQELLDSLEIMTNNITKQDETESDPLFSLVELYSQCKENLNEGFGSYSFRYFFHKANSLIQNIEKKMASPDQTISEVMTNALSVLSMIRPIFLHTNRLTEILAKVKLVKTPEGKQAMTEEATLNLFEILQAMLRFYSKLSGTDLNDILTQLVDAKLKTINSLIEKLKEIFPNLAQETNEAVAPKKFRLISQVPDNWIPYLPIKTNQENRLYLLEQSSLLGDELEPIMPTSYLLRSASPDGKSHRLNEETVSRSGLSLKSQIQRARWIDGRTYIWMSRKVTPGKGEGRSGLKFDFLDEDPKT